MSKTEENTVAIEHQFDSELPDSQDRLRNTVSCTTVLPEGRKRGSLQGDTAVVSTEFSTNFAHAATRRRVANIDRSLFSFL